MNWCRLIRDFDCFGFDWTEKQWLRYGLLVHRPYLPFGWGCLCEILQQDTAIGLHDHGSRPEGIRLGGEYSWSIPGSTLLGLVQHILPWRQIICQGTWWLLVVGFVSPSSPQPLVSNLGWWFVWFDWVSHCSDVWLNHKPDCENYLYILNTHHSRWVTISILWDNFPFLGDEYQQSCKFSGRDLLFLPSNTSGLLCIFPSAQHQWEDWFGWLIWTANLPWKMVWPSSMPYLLDDLVTPLGLVKIIHPRKWTVWHERTNFAGR